jgi:hypothetical protein
LIYCSARDDHLDESKVITYYDSGSFGHYIKGGGGLTFSPNNKLDLSLSLSYRYINGPRGDTVKNSFKFSEIAGMGYSALDLGVAVRYYIFGR